METVHRFITVRNPRKPTRKELKNGFLNLPKHAKPTLIAQVAANPRTGEGMIASRRLIGEFRNGPEFINDPEQIEERAPGLLEWADWLAAEAGRLTRERLEERPAGKAPELDPATLGWLWDNLLAHTYGGGDPDVRESIVWALRVENLLRSHGDIRGDEDLRRLAAATVLLPAGTHLEMSSGQKDRGAGERHAPAPAPAAPPLAGALERIAEIQAAADELSRRYRDQLELSRAAAVPPLRVPHVDAGGNIVFPRGMEGPAAEEERDDDADSRGVSGTAAQQQSPQQQPQLEKAAFARLSQKSRRLLAELDVAENARIPYVLEQLQAAAGDVARAAAVQTSPTQTVVQVGGAFWTRSTGGAPTTGATPGATPGATVPPPSPTQPPTRHDDSYNRFFATRECKVKPLGVADFRRVEQRLCCYEPGEIAHIENVLIGEHKDRSTRRLRRTEEMISIVNEEERTEERDTQTTDRFELQKESSKVVEQELSFDMGVEVVANYGPVKITADANFATSFSTTESDKTASKYAKEVTDRAMERIVKKVREERTTKTIEEFEETNKHGLDNTGGAEHIVGLYRWVDKVYEARLVNYGKRLMFEFLVPEPGAFHLHVMTEAPIESTVTLEKPIDPRTQEITAKLGLPRLISHESINEGSYAAYAAAYGAKVDPPPPVFVTTAKAYHREGMDHTVQFADSKNDLQVPDGYEATSFSAPFGLHSENHNGGNNWITLAVGRRSTFQTGGGTFSGALDGEDDVVPVVVMGRTRFYAVNVEVTCTRTADWLSRWKMKVFNALLDAYNEKLAAYNNALAEAKARVGVEIRGTNPLRNRTIERLELEKGCVRLLSQRCYEHWSDAMRDAQECGYPEFNCCEAIRDGSYVQFVEQAFEWRLMTYLFYPYFWGRKCNWRKIYQLDDVDPLFLNFLQAGYARVVVPVRDGYHDAALRFLADGTIWNGGSVPGVDDPMYVAISNEMKEPVGEVDPEVKPWMIRLPTSLVALQCDSGCIPGTGLPCPCEEEKPEP